MQLHDSQSSFENATPSSSTSPLTSYKYPPWFEPWGPFLERPGNLMGTESDFEIKASRKEGCVLTSNKVHFVSLADTFIVQFWNLLKLPSGMENKNASQAR